MVKFLRRTWKRYSKLGKGKKKKQVWRKPKGRDNKMREKRKGYPKVVSIGYKKEKKLRGKIQKKRPILIHNLKDLEKIRQDEIAIIGNVGEKKKTEILKKVKEKKISIHNINIKKFLEELEKKEKKPEVKSKEDSKEKKLKKRRKLKQKPWRKKDEPSNNEN